MRTKSSAFGGWAARCAGVASLLCLWPASGHGQQPPAEVLTGNVWQRLYHVPDAQMQDAAWLAGDDDGDGITNGAEVFAGTDPFNPGSIIQVTQISLDADGVHLTFPTLEGKQYVVQQTRTLGLGAAWASATPAVQLLGTNAPLTVTTGYTPDCFYRVLVQDVDSDEDGATDWAEIHLGLDPKNPHSNNQQDAFGRPLTDSEYATANLRGENTVAISVAPADASVAQPDAGATATGTAAFTVTRVGLPGYLKALSVNVAIGGTATPGTDYTAIANTVTLPAGIRSVRVPVSPLANPLRTGLVTVTMALQAGAGYSPGAAASSSLQIMPSTTPRGTGLTAGYYNGSSTTYGANFTVAPSATRTDATVDFKWSNVDTPAAGFTKPPGVPSATKFSVRWTGQVQPEYTERYWFTVNVDDGAVLKLNPTSINTQTTGAGAGQVLLNAWAVRGVSELTSIPVDLQAGVRYNIQLDYFTSATSGETHLSWYSNSQAKQIVPSSRLYPFLSGAGAAPPVMTSEATVYAYVNQTFSTALTASNSPTSITLQEGTLPPGVTLTAAGVLGGTPTAAGEYPITVRFSNDSGSSDAAVKVVILDTGGGLVKEVWPGLSAAPSLADIPLDTTAPIQGFLPTLEDTTKEYGDNYGERLRGYVTVQTSGNYYFWISANDTAELWVSNNSDPVNRVRRAAVTNGGASARTWSAQARQRSGWLNLVAGRKYYIEVLHKGLSGTANHVAVGWKLDPTGNDVPLADGTGVLPGHMLWTYYDLASYASSSAAAGTLFYAKLIPQGSSVSNGSGLGTLRLSDDQLHAVLAYSVTGLGSAVVGKHLHADAYLGKPAGSIIFDIDDATPQPDGSYVWDLAPVGVYSVADLQQIILQGKCYLNVHTVNYPGGEVKGNFSIANGAQIFVPPTPPPPLPSGSPTVAEASRFLTQATFGPTADDLAAVTTKGYRSWLGDQFALPPTNHSPLVVKRADAGTPWPSTMTFNAWWNRSITAPDQLRQRLAFALSETMVVSDVGPLNNRANALSAYYDLLLKNAFGNFRDLLKAVTLDAAMGNYLDMRANQKGDITVGRHANENYAREIMQLFSIGLNRLWPDGTLVLDANFNLIPTYDQDVITGVATVFTGWNYGQDRLGTGRLPTSFNPPSDFTRPMTLVPKYHDLTAKKLLDNVYLPSPPTSPNNYTDTNTTYVDPATGENAYDSNGVRDLDAVIDSLFNHPNVGPFICRQLIQRLVTSNPGSGYIYRVVQAFNGERNVDGQATGIRGDLKEVVRAILLDYEARSSALLSDTIFGKQREPVLRVTAPARYLAAKALPPATFTQSASAMHPGRLTITFPAGSTSPLNTNDSLSLVFDPTLTLGTQVPLSTNVSSSAYTVRSSSITGSGSSAVQTITVDAVGQFRATYGQVGNTITVTANGSSLKAGGSVYLKFAPGTGGQPADGVYAVDTLAADASSFTVTAATSATITGAADCILNRISNGGIVVSGSTVKILTTIPHGLAVGDKVTIVASGKLDGSRTDTVVTVPDATSFTVANLAAPDTLAAQSGGGVTIFPQVKMEMDRNGTLSAGTSTWNLGQTDAESTTSSVTQTPLRSQTVFNFFFPDYKQPGAITEQGLTTPEFQLTSETNTMALSNFLEQGFYNGTTSSYTDGRVSFRGGNESLMMDLSSLMAFTTASGVPALVDKLNAEMMGGVMSAGMRQTILNYVTPTNFPASSSTQIRDEVRAVLHLVITSPEYAIQK